MIKVVSSGGTIYTVYWPLISPNVHFFWKIESVYFCEKQNRFYQVVSILLARKESLKVVAISCALDNTKFNS